jgi:hypothetical protein
MNASAHCLIKSTICTFTGIYILRYFFLTDFRRWSVLIHTVNIWQSWMLNSYIVCEWKENLAQLGNV